MTSLTPRAAAIEALLVERGTSEARKWMYNYMRGTTPFFGCKMPVTRECVREVVLGNRKRGRDGSSERISESYIDDAVSLLRHTHGDAKQAGAILLCEHEPSETLATVESLQRLERDVLRGPHVNDWAVADSLGMKVFKKMWKHNASLAPIILAWAKDENATLWHRRCGVVAFVSYYKEQDLSEFPDDFGEQIVDACEANLLCAPNERFAQTGTAWVTRYALASSEDAVVQRARAMVTRHGTLWTTEAKKSLVERLAPGSALAREILAL